MKIMPIIAFLAVILTGCAVNNNYRTPEEFADRLRYDGIKVESVRAVRPDPFRANSAAAIKVFGSEIGVYKYDNSTKLQRSRLEHIEESGRLYISGIPYPVVVHGSFVFFGLDRNPGKRKIFKSISKFN